MSIEERINNSMEQFFILELNENENENKVFKFTLQCDAEGLREMSKVLQIFKEEGMFEKTNPALTKLAETFDYFCSHEEFDKTLDMYLENIENISNEERSMLIALTTNAILKIKQTLLLSYVTEEDIRELRKREDELWAYRNSFERREKQKKYV